MWYDTETIEPSELMGLGQEPCYSALSPTQNCPPRNDPNYHTETYDGRRFCVRNGFHIVYGGPGSIPGVVQITCVKDEPVVTITPGGYVPPTPVKCPIGQEPEKDKYGRPTGKCKKKATIQPVPGTVYVPLPPRKLPRKKKDGKVIDKLFTGEESIELEYVAEKVNSITTNAYLNIPPKNVVFEKIEPGFSNDRARYIYLVNLARSIENMNPQEWRDFVNFSSQQQVIFPEQQKLLINLKNFANPPIGFNDYSGASDIYLGISELISNSVNHIRDLARHYKKFGVRGLGRHPPIRLRRKPAIAPPLLILIGGAILAYSLWGRKR